MSVISNKINDSDIAFDATISPQDWCQHEENGEINELSNLSVNQVCESIQTFVRGCENGAPAWGCVLSNGDWSAFDTDNDLDSVKGRMNTTASVIGDDIIVNEWNVNAEGVSTLHTRYIVGRNSIKYQLVAPDDYCYSINWGEDTPVIPYHTLEDRDGAPTIRFEDGPTIRSKVMWAFY